jgi:hypothetical protein
MELQVVFFKRFGSRTNQNPDEDQAVQEIHRGKTDSIVKDETHP